MNRLPARALLSYFENVQVPILAERKQIWHYKFDTLDKGHAHSSAYTMN